jgi:hypothetical protein
MTHHSEKRALGPVRQVGRFRYFYESALRARARLDLPDEGYVRGHQNDQDQRGGSRQQDHAEIEALTLLPHLVPQHPLFVLRHLVGDGVHLGRRQLGSSEGYGNVYRVERVTLDHGLHHGVERRELLPQHPQTPGLRLVVGNESFEAEKGIHRRFQLQFPRRFRALR